MQSISEIHARARNTCISSSSLSRHSFNDFPAFSDFEIFNAIVNTPLDSLLLFDEQLFLSFYGGEVSASALRLDQRTELNRLYSEYLSMRYCYGENQTSKRIINVRDYGSGVVEVGYSSNVSLRGSSRSSEPVIGCMTEAEYNSNLSRSMSRSRAQVRRKCMAARLDYLLTFTYRVNYSPDGSCDSRFTDSKQTFKDLTRFLRLLRKHYSVFHYVAVVEKTKKGANHLHLAVKGFQNVQLLRKLWLSVVGCGNGNIDVIGHNKRIKSSFAKLASYLSKYITKSSSSVYARQRYRVSEGIEIPSHIQIVEFPVNYSDFLQDVFDSLGVNQSHHWKSDNKAHGWACSW